MNDHGKGHVTRLVSSRLTDSALTVWKIKTTGPSGRHIRVLINYNKTQRTQNLKRMKLRAFAREHDESVVSGTAAENKMHRTTAENL